MFTARGSTHVKHDKYSNLHTQDFPHTLYITHILHWLKWNLNALNTQITEHIYTYTHHNNKVIWEAWRSNIQICQREKNDNSIESQSPGLLWLWLFIWSSTVQSEWTQILISFRIWKHLQASNHFSFIQVHSWALSQLLLHQLFSFSSVTTVKVCRRVKTLVCKDFAIYFPQTPPPYQKKKNEWVKSITFRIWLCGNHFPFTWWQLSDLYNWCKMVVILGGPIWWST